MNKGIILADCLLCVLIVSLLACLCIASVKVYEKYKEIVSDYKQEEVELY